MPARDQIITLQVPETFADGIGGVLKSWVDVGRAARVWAAVTIPRGKEMMEDGRLNARQTATFEIIYRADLSELNRIIWQGEAWDIRNIQRLGGRRMTLVIDAERGVAS